MKASRGGTMTEIAGLLFDKDGTLFDFHASWGAWAAGLMQDLAGGDAARAEVLGRAVGYDMEARAFHPESLAIAGTPDQIAAALLPLLPGASPAGLLARMNAMAATATMVPATPLGPLLAQLRARGLRIGLASNDSEGAVHGHLRAAGIVEAFDFIAGHDSGHGEKPGPGMALAFAAACGLAPGQAVMVGDSLHDMQAGRAAGMRTVAVLTGPATRRDLAPLADAVLPDIGHLPAWLDAVARPGAASRGAEADAASAVPPPMSAGGIGRAVQGHPPGGAAGVPGSVPVRHRPDRPPLIRIGLPG